MVKWFHVYCPTGFVFKAMEKAAEVGDLAVLEWLASNHENVIWSPSFMDAAATNDHLHVLKWLHANRSEGCTTDAMNGVADGKQLQALQ
uniref:Ankyrin repeat-containing domain n=1 Tax=Globisporangium ultimum (strain ATCC 200006 / CBS 805.95 / DAOM BR144) TaxID=431595 RepID=K3WWS3_GLOUD